MNGTPGHLVLVAPSIAPPTALRHVWPQQVCFCGLLQEPTRRNRSRNGRALSARNSIVTARPSHQHLPLPPGSHIATAMISTYIRRMTGCGRAGRRAAEGSGGGRCIARAHYTGTGEVSRGRSSAFLRIVLEPRKPALYVSTRHSG